MIGILGHNGAGKTTLLSILTGLLKQQGGNITFDGRQLSPRQRRAMSYLVMQDTDYQLFASSVEEELSLGIREDCKEKVDKANMIIPQIAENETMYRLIDKVIVYSNQEIKIVWKINDFFQTTDKE